MPDDLHQRARDVLAQLSVISEGAATQWDSGSHGQADSKEPVNLEALDRMLEREGEPGAPPKERSLYDYYAHWFAVSWRNDERLLYWVASAEDDLEKRQRTGQPQRELATGDERSKQILKMRGPAAEVAAKVGVNIAHIKSLRRQHKHDPKTGDPWPINRDVALELAAQLRAREPGITWRALADRTGVPAMTLHDHFREKPREGVHSRTSDPHAA